MKRIMLALAWGVCAFGLMLSTVACAADNGAHIPVGSRLSVEGADESNEVDENDKRAQEEQQEREDQPEVVRLGLFLSETIHPGATHQVVEYMTGPLAIPLIDGRTYVLPYGFYVRLEDTSIWRVMDEDGWAVQDWLPSDSLNLTTHRTWFSTRYQYNLVNLNTQIQVRVCPEVGPRLDWSLRRFVYDRSLITNEVILNDGSLWRVTKADAQIFAKWLPEDSVIIGVNTDWMSFRRANLLINLTTNDCVRCSWIR